MVMIKKGGVGQNKPTATKPVMPKKVPIGGNKSQSPSQTQEKK